MLFNRCRCCYCRHRALWMCVCAFKRGWRLWSSQEVASWPLHGAGVDVLSSSSSSSWLGHACPIIVVFIVFCRRHPCLVVMAFSMCVSSFSSLSFWYGCAAVVVFIFVVVAWTLCGPTLSLHRGGLYWHGNAVATLPPPPDVPGVETNMSMTTNAPDIIRMPRKRMKPPDSPIGPAKRTQTRQTVTAAMQKRRVYIRMCKVLQAT